ELPVIHIPITGDQLQIASIVRDVRILIALSKIGVKFGRKHQLFLPNWKKPGWLEKQGIDTAGLLRRLAIGFVLISHPHGIGMKTFTHQDLLPEETGPVAAVLKRPRVCAEIP